MTHLTRIICHIRTSSGPRFSVHHNEEDLAHSLVEYWNEVHAENESNEISILTSLDEVIEIIEEKEDLSWEQVLIELSDNDRRKVLEDCCSEL